MLWLLFMQCRQNKACTLRQGWMKRILQSYIEILILIRVLYKPWHIIVQFSLIVSKLRSCTVYTVCSQCVALQTLPFWYDQSQSYFIFGLTRASFALHHCTFLSLCMSLGWPTWSSSLVVLQHSWKVMLVPLRSRLDRRWLWWALLLRRNCTCSL